MKVVWGALAGEGVAETPSSSTSGMATPGKTSSSVKVKYHSVSSLISHTPSANRQDSPPVGGLFCALAYATVFPLGTSLISQLAKIDLGGGMNFCRWRQGGGGHALSVAISSFSSCSQRGSWKDAQTCLASFLVSCFPGTVDSSLHQSGDIIHLGFPHDPSC